jgi:hypothetical protein
MKNPRSRAECNNSTRRRVPKNYKKLRSQVPAPIGRGEADFRNPFAQHRGGDRKRQLVRASIVAIGAMRDVNRASHISGRMEGA